MVSDKSAHVKDEPEEAGGNGRGTDDYRKEKVDKKDCALYMEADTTLDSRTANTSVGIVECMGIIDLRTVGTRTERGIDLKEEVSDPRAEIETPEDNQHPGKA